LAFSLLNTLLYLCFEVDFVAKLSDKSVDVYLGRRHAEDPDRMQRSKQAWSVAVGAKRRRASIAVTSSGRITTSAIVTASGTAAPVVRL
jgi:hypothetical protein